MKTNSAITPFLFNAHTVRVIADEHGEPWFVAADVCAILGLSNPSMAIKVLDVDEVTLSSIEGSHRPTNLVSESGLYTLIVRSDKPEARTFRKWVTAEVLPSIRKTGGYGRAKDPMELLSDPAAMRALLLTYSEKVLTLESQVAEQAPKVQALERLAASEGARCITNAAKDLQIRPKALFAVLSSRRWIYKRPGGSGWIAYQDKIQAGFLEHKITTVSRSDGSEKVVEQVLVTPKGLARLAGLLREETA